MRVSKGKIKDIFLSLLVVFSIMISGVSFMKADVSAASYALTDIAQEVKVSSLKNGTTELIGNQGVTVTYGDQINVTLDWSFKNIPDGGPVLVPGDSYTYALPTNMSFTHAQGDLLDSGNNKLGTYDITGSTITITYTDNDFCQVNDNRVGSLLFEGKIVDDGNGGQTVKTVTVTFPVNQSFNIMMVPPATTAAVHVSKGFNTIDSTHHIYECIIAATSVGDNTNVKLYDFMWPGMHLYKSCEFYRIVNNVKVPLDPSEYTDTSAAPASDTRELSATIGAMSHGEVIYVRYEVEVVPEMYDWDTANDYASKFPHLYPNQYGGNVPNRIDISSTEDPTVESAWADIITLRASFGKWEHVPYNDYENGLMGWYVKIYSTYGLGFSNGYVVDTLPKNSTVVESSIQVLAGSTVMDNAINLKYDTDTQGNTIVYLTFTKDLMDFLNAAEGNNAHIYYQTKVNEQTKDVDRYENKAEIFFDGVSKQKTGADVDYTKPSELKKAVDYSATTAPYAYYSLTVNSAALKLSSDGKLTLIDTMSSSYDLDMSSVKINGKAASSSEFKYDASTRTMTFELNDSTRYDITYRAAVNLMPGSTLDDNNSGNSAKLLASQIEIISTESKLNCEVFKAAGSSSSNVVYSTLNVIKHKDGSTTTTLSGAQFTLTTMSMDKSGNVTTGSEVSKTTDANGKISFGSLNRSTVYMLTETAAPDGYKKIETPSFYAFAASGSTLPSSIKYNGTNYTLNVIADNKISYDVYIANEAEVSGTSTPTTPATPSGNQSSTDPKTDPSGGNGGQGNSNSDGTNNPTTTPATTSTTTPTPTPTPSTVKTSDKTDSKVTKTGEERSMEFIIGVSLFAFAIALGAAYISMKFKED